LSYRGVLLNSGGNFNPPSQSSSALIQTKFEQTLTFQDHTTNHPLTYQQGSRQAWETGRGLLVRGHVKAGCPTTTLSVGHAICHFKHKCLLRHSLCLYTVYPPTQPEANKIDICNFPCSLRTPRPEGHSCSDKENPRRAGGIQKDTDLYAVYVYGFLSFRMDERLSSRLKTGTLASH
jgi:hypothetical protein